MSRSTGSQRGTRGAQSSRRALRATRRRGRSRACRRYRVLLWFGAVVRTADRADVEVTSVLQHQRAAVGEPRIGLALIALHHGGHAVGEVGLLQSVAGPLNWSRGFHPPMLPRAARPFAGP